MEVTAVAIAAMVCGSSLLGFRWWLDSRKTPSGIPSELLERIQQLEAWRTRSELGKMR